MEIPIRRFASEATPEYWAGFHSWFKDAKPRPHVVVQMPERKKESAGTGYQRFEAAQYASMALS